MLHIKKKLVRFKNYSHSGTLLSRIIHCIGLKVKRLNEVLKLILELKCGSKYST